MKGVAKSLDVHPTTSLSEDKLKNLRIELPDEFSVTRENIMYSFEISSLKVSNHLVETSQL